MAVTEITRHRVAIAGSIADAVTGRAIPGAVITIGTKLQAVSREDGSYYFIDLAPGTYRLTVTVPGMGSRYGSLKTPGISVQNAADGRPLLDGKANVTMPPTSVSGTVKRNSDGQALKGARVRILGSESETVTDESGKYTIAGLLAGGPNVEASAAGHAPVVKKAVLSAGAETVVNFSLT